MARFDRISVFKKMEQTGLVPLFYDFDPQRAKKILLACYEGGARLLEFTARGHRAKQVFDSLVDFADQQLPDMILGVGSLVDMASASAFIDMGADFVVTPMLRADIAKVCNRRKIFWSAGCGSLFEIAKAEELGCELVKLFPASVYGANFIKSVKAPCPWTRIMPTGGVGIDKKNLSEWFQAGATCVGLGSNLIVKRTDGTYDYDMIKTNTQRTIATIDTIKKGLL